MNVVGQDDIPSDRPPTGLLPCREQECMHVRSGKNPFSSGGTNGQKDNWRQIASGEDVLAGRVFPTDLFHVFKDEGG